MYGHAEEVSEQGVVVDHGLAQVLGRGRARGGLDADLLGCPVAVKGA
jgi:hypothetical protein